MLKANIFSIKKFAVHDGDGIRTTVFFKGCPLKCVWCHNPEGISFKSQLGYFEHKCISCGECIYACEYGAHIIGEKGHDFLRDKCVSCGRCEDACGNGALLFYGKEYSVEKLIPILLEDKDFYDNSGGGVTLSGGECLSQADFCAELLKELKKHGIHTAVDTCGFVPRQAVEKVMPYTDIFLYDLKAFDDDVHVKCTGKSNKLILENLEFIDKSGKNIEIRIPYVPDFNDDQMEKMAKYLKSFKNISKIKVLPYHNYAGSKYSAINFENSLPKRLPTKDEIVKVENIFNLSD